MKFTCPICGSHLEIKESGAAVCPRRHSFDRSREGYYNLLLTASGGVHGDNREMLMARRRFLDTGAYLPLAKAVSEELIRHAKEPYAVLDMGCGEGYYTSLVEEALTERGISADISAFDISKDAVKLAAKRNKRISYAVASSYKIPAEGESFDAVFNVFSPMAEAETARVLKSGGIFVFVAPNKEHLWELKSLVYDKPYRNEPRSSELSGFELLSERELSFKMELPTGECVRDLFSMTPYAYRTSEKERARLDACTSLLCRAEFLIFTYKKL